VANLNGSIGYDGGAGNSVLVTGAGSLWTNSATLMIGFRGNGNSLTVADGGSVSASDLYVGYGNQDGGSSNSLIITNGGTVSAGDSYIGYGEAVTASNNSVLVTGPNSLWTNSGNLVVGSSDTNYPSLIVSDNSLVISNGGTVRNFDGFIG
jgi:T5SS/PEP-CTERM-associated repeat protein